MRDQLLDLCRIVFDEEGFASESRILEDDGELLLVENEFFVIGVVSAPSIQSLFERSVRASDTLTDLLRAGMLGAKRWDVYLVGLTSQAHVDIGPSTDLFAFMYDTKDFRRIARVGIAPTLDEVRSAMSEFFPLPRVNDADQHRSPLNQLRAALLEEGVESDLVERSVAAFEQGVSFESV